MNLKQTTTEVARNFADFINRVAYRGERFTLIRGNKPVAELRPVVSGRRLRELPAILESLPHLSPEDRESYSEAVAEVQRTTREERLRDPWAS